MLDPPPVSSSKRKVEVVSEPMAFEDVSDATSLRPSKEARGMGGGGANE